VLQSQLRCSKSFVLNYLGNTKKIPKAKVKPTFTDRKTSKLDLKPLGKAKNLGGRECSRALFSFRVDGYSPGHVAGIVEVRNHCDR
jgi:hypothetical protein